MPIAKAFGGEFPVCDEKQVTALEQAYEAYKKQDCSEELGKVCSCDIIIALLKGEATPAMQAHAAFALAKEVYAQKVAPPVSARPAMLAILIPGEAAPQSLENMPTKGKPN